MSKGDLLFRVQQLQFREKATAEALLLAFVRETFPQLNVSRLELRPQATSLNSFNGFLTLADDSRLFFKTHVEQDNVISEYYNAEMLAAAGYPVIQPLYSSTNSGQQILIYPVINSPPVFDVARRIERSDAYDSEEAQRLTEMQHRSDDALLSCYFNTLEHTPADNAQAAPIHQLFWHRITGGRFQRFYGEGTRFTLPHGEFSSDTVLDVQWTINGSSYDVTLRQLVDHAETLLHPHRDEFTVIGHGDAHNGNVFMTESGLVYFDPAFAGRHSPLFDLVKPIFHNVFAMWMYFPQEERDVLGIEVESRSETGWSVDYDYAKNNIREMFFASKVERVLRPIVEELRRRDMLEDGWKTRFKLALMCCPLLTMNLTQFPPEIALLGLCFAVEMGAESRGRRSVIDAVLDTL